MRLYSCKIWKTVAFEGVPLIRDFIPCKNASGEVGLWDDVNSVFYGNAGTGTFIAGELPALTAHKTLINGTAYTIKGGKCMVDGTVYNILKGRTLIGGTGYDIAFEETIGKTWRFNDTISCWDGMTWNVNFVALGYPCTSIYSTYNNNLFYTTPSLGGFMARDAAGNWNNEEYRTVTFDEPPTGDFLTWLQANATPQ